MDIASRERFDAVADDYERSRPGYPSELIDRLQPPCQTLEIGCGSGQLTVDLLSCGHHVVAVDIGSRLLAYAARRCPEGNFVLGAFEEIDLEPHRFDLVVSATAFHWVRPDRRLPQGRGAAAPRPRLALLSHRIVAGPCSDHFDAVVRRCAPSFPVGSTPLGMDTAGDRRCYKRR